MSLVIVGIDLGKNSCSIAGLDRAGAVVMRRRMRGDGVIAFASKLPACIVAMEACCGARHMERTPAALGHAECHRIGTAVGNAATLKRDAIWLRGGRVPRQAPTGGKPKLPGITKRGSRYLRKMLTQGAGSAMPTLAQANSAMGAWLRALLVRAHPHVAVLAPAAQMARTVRALLRHGRNHEAVPHAAGRGTRARLEHSRAQHAASGGRRMA